MTINAMVLFYVTTSSTSTQAISERDGVPIKEPMSGGGNLSSPSATAQSFGGQQRSTLGGGGGARPTVIVGRGGARGALMSARDAARNDYVFFPEPIEPLDPSKLGETDVSPEDGGAFPPSSSFFLLPFAGTFRTDTDTLCFPSPSSLHCSAAKQEGT